MTRFTVGTTPVQLDPGTASSLLIVNNSTTGTVLVGPGNHPLRPGRSVAVQRDSGEATFAVAESDTLTVDVTVTGTYPAAAVVPAANPSYPPENLIGTAAQWTAHDLVLDRGQEGIQTGTPGTELVKIGDGATRFSQLPSAGGGGAAYLTQAAAAAAYLTQSAAAAAYLTPAAATATYAALGAKGMDAALAADTTAMKRWRAALSNRDYARAKVLIMGGSTVQGWGATDYQRRWAALVRDRLRLRYQTAGIGSGGGVGHIPPYGSSPTFTLPVTLVSGGTADANGIDGISSLLRSTTTDKVTWTFTGTGVDVWYTKLAAGGTVNVNIDGGSVGTFSAFAASTTTSQVYQVRSLAATSHTIDLTVTDVGAGKQVYVEGITVYNGDEAKGITLYDTGRAGYGTKEWLVQTGTGNYTRWKAAVAAIDPDLIVFQLGLNDYEYAGGWSAAQFKTNFQQLVTDMAAQCTLRPGMLVTIPQQRPEAQVAGNDPWSSYRQAMFDMAAVDSGLAVCDVGNRIGLGSDSTYSYWYDGTHPSDKGHSYFADEIVKTLALLY